MSYGFDKAKAAPATPAADAPRKLDLGNIGVVPAPVPSPAQEARAIEAGTSLGFTDRGSAGGSSAAPAAPSVPAGEPVVRVRSAREPQKNLFIKGPQRVTDRFIRFANDSGADSYWEALEKLLDAHQAQKH